MQRLFSVQSRFQGVLAVLALASLCALAACRPERASNLGVQAIAGRSLAGEPVRFAGLDAAGVILNVYSPTCGPCLEELPALHALYQESRKLGVAMFLVVEDDPMRHGIDLDPTASREERFQRIGARLREDQARYNIEIPFVILDATFRVGPAELVTATPETLFFRMAPLQLEYNLVGPISAFSQPEEIALDSRYRFALSALRRIGAPRTDPYATEPPGIMGGGG